VLDRPYETLLGYIPSMPMAFSAFRWFAIRGEPLTVFLKAEEEGIDFGP